MKWTLPKPPTANTVYRTSIKNGRSFTYMTQRGRDWFSQCGLLVRASLKRKKPLASEVEVAIDLYTARAQDLDNILKPSLDLLEKAGVIENDRLVTSLVLNKYRCKKKDERIELSIYEGGSQ